MPVQDFVRLITEHRSPSGNTRVDYVDCEGLKVPRFVNEFWTSRQRQASSLHEISYRACFKPQLPRFFIDALTEPGDLVYDPFAGRGTTAIEAGLRERRALANDINPLSALMTLPRFFVPPVEALEARLHSIPLRGHGRADIDLSMFYHQRTEREIVALRSYLLTREAEGKADDLDRWIGMVATNRLSGHSAGFFSVYTLPPNQAATPRGQTLINIKRGQVPQYKAIVPLIMKKSASLVRDLDEVQIARLIRAGKSARFYCRDARRVKEIAAGTVKLTVTSPPFLDVVQYARDNWLRCWFNGISPQDVGDKMTVTRSLGEWKQIMADVLVELHRVTAPGGWVAFEVGEIRRGSILLDEETVSLGAAAGFHCVGILLNAQKFTKTANIWGVSNNVRGTNSNRIVLFYKDGGDEKRGA